MPHPQQTRRIRVGLPQVSGQGTEGLGDRRHGTVVLDTNGRVQVTLKISDPAARADLAALQREVTRSPQQAAAFLREAGILTPTGRLARRFGG